MRCIIVDDDKLVHQTLQNYISKLEYLELASNFENAIEALNFLKEESVDLIFLDVEMPEMTGLELAEALNGSEKIILMTSHKDYAVEAFEVEVCDFLLKPIEFPRFVKAVEKVQGTFVNPSGLKVEDQFLFIKDKSQLTKVQLTDVSIIQALGDYVTILTPNKKYIVHTSMKLIEDKIPSEIFLRVHRSYIVNIQKVDSLEDSSLSVAGKIVPVSKSYRSKLLGRINIA